MESINAIFGLNSKDRHAVSYTLWLEWRNISSYALNSVAQFHFILTRNPHRFLQALQLDSKETMSNLFTKNLEMLALCDTNSYLHPIGFVQAMQPMPEELTKLFNE